MKNSVSFINRIICVFSAIVASVFIAGMPMETAKADITEIKGLQEMIDNLAILVNADRAEKGLEPMYVVPYMNEIAGIRAEELITSFVHARPDGSDWRTVINDDILPYRTTGEIIAAGKSSVEGTFEQWKNSPKHYEIMMSEKMTHMGVGIAYDPDSEYKWYWTIAFAGLDTDWCEYLGWQTDSNGVPIVEGQYTVYKADSYKTGDINGDGSIDCFDLVLLRKYLLKEINFTSVQIEAADIVYDGAVSYLDASYLKRYIFGEISELPVRLF